jgi:hypothetical protein
VTVGRAEDEAPVQEERLQNREDHRHDEQQEVVDGVAERELQADEEQVAREGVPAADDEVPDPLVSEQHRGEAPHRSGGSSG